MRKIDTYIGEKGFYANKLMSYYYSKKNDLNGKIEQLKIDHDISDIKSLSSLTKVHSIKNIDTEFWNDVTGDFGEACLAWRLEEGILKDDIFWATVRFVGSPLKGSKGVDLMGIQKSNMKICFGESKFRNSIKKGDIKNKVQELSEQLFDSKLDKILTGEHGGFSYDSYQSLQWLKDHLMDLMDKRELPFDGKTIDKLFNTKGYSKFGSVIRPKNDLPMKELFDQAFELIDQNCKELKKCSKTCDPNCKERNPITLIDFQFECLMLEIESFLRSKCKN